MSNDLRPPSRLNLLRELAVGADMIGAPAALMRARMRRKVPNSGRAVIVLPGFGANDASTAPMRYFLSQQGHQVEGWGLGLNTGGRGLVTDVNDLPERWEFDREVATPGEAEVPALCEKMVGRTQARVAALGRPVTLIGWSLGGYIAREVARELPGEVEAVITMGSPVVGGPKYTATAPLFRRRGLDLDRMEGEIGKRAKIPLTQPVTAIYSKSDGIVGWQAAIDRDSENIRHIEVNVSHMGLGVNAKVWGIVQAALEAQG